MDIETINRLKFRDGKAMMFVAYYGAFEMHRLSCQTCKTSIEECTTGKFAFLNMTNSLDEMRAAYKGEVHGP